jgi:hypothetical protein
MTHPKPVPRSTHGMSQERLKAPSDAWVNLTGGSKTVDRSGYFGDTAESSDFNCP